MENRLISFSELETFTARSGGIRTFIYNRLLPEFFGVFFLVFGGILLIAVMVNPESLFSAHVSSTSALGRFLCGVIFAGYVSLLFFTPLSKGGGGLSTSLTLALWLKKDLTTSHTLALLASQVMGGITGALPLFLVGKQAAVINYGANFPADNVSAGLALTGEIMATFLIVLISLAGQELRWGRGKSSLMITLAFGLLFVVEGPLTGTSTNFARTIGPNLLAGKTCSLWIFAVGPSIGAILASVLVTTIKARLQKKIR